MRLICIILLLLLSSCLHKKAGNSLPVIIPDEFSAKSKNILDCVDTVMYVQLDNSILIPKIIKSFWLDSCIIVHSYEGILRYDEKGRFMYKIGDVGEGPEEYPRNLYYVTVDKVEQVVYVYLIFQEELLSYSFSGKFLNRVPVQIPTNLKKIVYPEPNAFFVQDDLLFFYYNTNQGLDKTKPLYWLSVDKDGRLVHFRKGYDDKLKNTNGAGFFLFPMNACDNTVVYWDLLNDTVFSVGAHGATPVYLWGKGNFRLLETDGMSIPIERRICTMFADTNLFSLFLLTNYGSGDSKVMFYGFYDKQQKLFYRLGEEELIFDKKTGLSLWGRELQYDVIDRREYLLTQVQTVDLMNISELLPWGIDPDDLEGNPVLVLIRLKDE